MSSSTQFSKSESLNAKPAFTLIEILVVTALVAITTISVAVSLPNSKNRAHFHDNQLKVTDIIQKARARSLSTLLLESQTTPGEFSPSVHYGLDVHRFFIRTFVMAENGTMEELDRVDLKNNAYITRYDNTECTVLGTDIPCITVFYQLPNGNVCFSENCNDESCGSRSFLLHSENDEYVTQFIIDIVGGFPEIGRQFTPENPFDPSDIGSPSCE